MYLFQLRAESFEFWASHLQATKPVLDIVQHGYYLPFLWPPDSYSSPNHKSALLNAEFIDTAIADLMHVAPCLLLRMPVVRRDW